MILDLHELADEWQEVLDDDDDDEEWRAQESAKFVDLCETLMLTPVEPDTLRWWADNNERTLISDDGEFVKYAQQLAEDIGAVDDFSRWPCTCIDWERAANELRSDYTSITYDGDDYLMGS